MNLALPALLVFVLLLPGFAFRSRFKRAERSSLDFSPFGQVVIEGVVFAVLLHALWLALAYFGFGRTLRVESLLQVVIADPAAQAQAVRAIAAAKEWVAFYFLSLLLFSFYFPTLARRVIVRWKLDRFSSRVAPLVRFHQAPWYYLLTAADFEPGEEPDLIVLAAIVDTKGGQPALYTGVLQDYFVRADGELDRVVLSGVMRRTLASDQADEAGPSPERFYRIRGDYFVLRYSEAITLNIRYVKLPQEVAGGEVEHATAQAVAVG